MTPATSIDEVVPVAIERLAADGFIAYPTETVWGLGACADRPGAVQRLLDWKGRATDSPLAVLVPDAEGAARIGCELDGPIRRLMEAFWPGPLMVVVPCRASWAPGVARSDGALGLRCSSDPLASALAAGLVQAGLGPLTSTSLNRSGQAPARDLDQAKRLAKAPGAESEPDPLGAPLLICPEGHDAGGTLPSTVVDCTGPEPRVLREGAIASDVIRQAVSG